MKNNILLEDIIADMHTHTVFSKHAYSTVFENIQEAEKKGLKYIAITDHFFNNGDFLDKKNETTRIAYLEMKIADREHIKVIGGEEFNIAQEIEYWDKLKDIVWRPIGLHNWFFDTDNCTLDELYKEFEKSVGRHNAFVHIERELHRIDKAKHGGNLDSEIKDFLKSICILAKKNNIFMEINEASLVRDEDGIIDRIKYWVEFAKKNNNRICLGTDAHYCKEVGDFRNVLKLLNEFEYPKELILNCNESQILDLYKK